MRLFQNGKPQRVRVTAEFPKAAVDQGWLAALPYDNWSAIWPMVVEKAYATLHNGYGGISNGGYATQALTAITGKPSHTVKSKDMDTINQLADAFEHGGALVAESLFNNEAKGNKLYESGKLVAGHDYAVSNVNRKAGTVTLRNPWGPDEPPVTLTLAQLRSSVDDVVINPVH